MTPGKELFAAVSSLCNVAGGLSLSQIVGITGLEASTIQNWVKRGWISRPVGKKYTQRQIARILLINVLRDCLPLEKIAQHFIQAKIIRPQVRPYCTNNYYAVLIRQDELAQEVQRIVH